VNPFVLQASATLLGPGACGSGYSKSGPSELPRPSRRRCVRQPFSANAPSSPGVRWGGMRNPCHPGLRAPDRGFESTVVSRSGCKKGGASWGSGCRVCSELLLDRPSLGDPRTNPEVLAASPVPAARPSRSAPAAPPWVTPWHVPCSAMAPEDEDGRFPSTHPCAKTVALKWSNLRRCELGQTEDCHLPLLKIHSRPSARKKTLRPVAKPSPRIYWRLLKASSRPRRPPP